MKAAVAEEATADAETITAVAAVVLAAHVVAENAAVADLLAEAGLQGQAETAEPQEAVAIAGPQGEAILLTGKEDHAEANS